MGRREEGGGSCWQADGCECRVLIKSHLGTMAFSYLEPALHKAQLVRREDSPLPFFSSSYSFPRVCGNVWHPAQPTGVSFNQKTCQVSLLLDCLMATCRHQKGQLQEARPLQPWLPGLLGVSLHSCLALRNTLGIRRGPTPMSSSNYTACTTPSRHRAQSRGSNCPANRHFKD